MNSCDIKIQKKLGDGWSGSVYACKIGNINGIYKIEKTDSFLANNSNYCRQIEFSNSLGNKHPDKFLSLIQSGILHNCDYELPIPPNMPNYIKKEKLRLNKLKTCTYLIYTPVLDGTLRYIINKLTAAEYSQMVKQIINIINIMHKNGYLHRDIHDENIMYKKVDGGYRWFIIDYGLIYNKNYAENESDSFINKKMWKNDKIAFVYSILYIPILELVEERGLKINAFEERVAYIKSTSVFNDIKKYIRRGLSPSDTNEMLIILTVILHCDVFIKSLGLNYDSYSDYDVKQKYNKILFNLINDI